MCALTLHLPCLCLCTVKLETLALAKSDSKNFASKSAYFCFILYAYFFLVAFEGLKFGDLTPICQSRQSFHSLKFLVLRYTLLNKRLTLNII